MGLSISIKIEIEDDESAKEWLKDIEQCNVDYQEAMDGAGKSLQAIKDGGNSGELIDQLWDAGQSVMTAAKETFEAINAIGALVLKVLQLRNNFESKAFGLIKQAAGLLGI